MDFQKINDRWVYSLTLQVFAQNLVTYIIIAFLNTVFAIAQGLIPFMGIFSMIVMTYLSAVSFMVAHRTILKGEVLTPGEAFAITPQSKTYFWQFVIISGIPLLVGIVGVVLVFVSDTLLVDLNKMLLIVFAVAMAAYYVCMAFFGTSLVATAVDGDGMMMVSRGRETFFYSLTRLIALPTLVVVGFSAAVYYLFLKDDRFSIADVIPIFGESAGDAIVTILLISVGVQLMIILLNLITAVVVTKAFLLAEVRLAVKREPTEWGKQAFGIAEQSRGVVYR